VRNAAQITIEEGEKLFKKKYAGNFKLVSQHSPETARVKLRHHSRQPVPGLEVNSLKRMDHGVKHLNTQINSLMPNDL
jgi:hypothetical protein